MTRLLTCAALIIIALGILSVNGQEQQKPYTAANETNVEEVVVETSLWVRNKPAAASRRQQLTRAKREISHSASHSESKLKSNALNPVVGHHKSSVEQPSGFVQAFFAKDFHNGGVKGNQRAFDKQKLVKSTKQSSNHLA
ncbi:uncharacterized protein LOC129724088 isoform X2 [Wyeomyia smithii]|uniref:uncharacterized protein LOC129724088 isoform X2 n=1 Tax=Wyeomyia smithii TaxID=174621 RepID=UPI002468015C|nr:uncharacterized protein LOC129724088 isoform X2 [Wyeomyia smithii]